MVKSDGLRSLENDESPHELNKQSSARNTSGSGKNLNMQLWDSENRNMGFLKVSN